MALTSSAPPTSSAPAFDAFVGEERCFLSLAMRLAKSQAPSDCVMLLSAYEHFLHRSVGVFHYVHCAALRFRQLVALQRVYADDMTQRVRLIGGNAVRRVVVCGWEAFVVVGDESVDKFDRVCDNRSTNPHTVIHKYHTSRSGWA